jgi:hypothetical protein
MWDAGKLLRSLLLGLFRPRASLEAENSALRQLIIVLQRTPKRLRFNTIDRMIWTAPRFPEAIFVENYAAILGPSRVA